MNIVREHRKFFLATALAGLSLRALFLVYVPAVTDDSRIYADFATTWLQHGVYGQTQLGQIVPADTRLPGYPAFLAAIFAVFGSGNFTAVLLAQILLDLVTCLIVADLARRMVSERAARIAFVLAALCPFLANYAAAALTETLETFFAALALDCAAAALGRMNLEQPCAKLWATTGAAIGTCILLRPDGGILLASIGLYLIALAWQRRGGRNMAPVVKAAALVSALTLAPLVPWTVRNFRTLHHFQPLAPRYANASDELALRGFNRWVKTWIVDYASVEEIYWSVPGDKMDAAKLPNRTFDSPLQHDTTLALIADYNQTQEMTRELDARFGELAAERIRTRPPRYYLLVPALRIADMWLRPRTEILPPDVRWWEFNDDTKMSVMAVGLGLLNLAYVGAGLAALARRPSGIRYAGLFVVFLLLRSVFLGTLENPEPRYTLECYPAIIVLAAALVEGRRLLRSTHL
jgi:4-amino-4-deoxy-L-arabinose transferase-like glycosyltransferase